jgi:hypothetical protein
MKAGKRFARLDRTRRVLLTDGWHEVARGAFDIDCRDDFFQFSTPEGTVIVGPLASILAVERGQ